jgi:hypothetical protein
MIYGQQDARPQGQDLYCDMPSDDDEEEEDEDGERADYAT